MRVNVTRTSTLPAVDAVGIGSHHAAAGDMGLGYYDNDMVASQAQGSGDDAATIAFGLDPDQDRILTEATTTSSGTKTLTNHYDDASDETAWTSTLKPDGTTVTKRYVDGIDGNLAAVVADDGTVKLDLSNLHGDTVATIDPSVTSIGNYHETTEYGLARDAATAADDYGWLGGKKRSSDDLGGLTLMGVRLYNPATGRFLSTDPIYGGNANAYTYPTDPINGYDLTGKTTRQMDDTNPPQGKSHGKSKSSHKLSKVAATKPAPVKHPSIEKKTKECNWGCSLSHHITAGEHDGVKAAGAGAAGGGAFGCIVTAAAGCVEGSALSGAIGGTLGFVGGGLYGLIHGRLSHRRAKR
jgi:RHS repeat-associated protein